MYGFIIGSLLSVFETIDFQGSRIQGFKDSSEVDKNHYWNPGILDSLTSLIIGYL